MRRTAAILLAASALLLGGCGGGGGGGGSGHSLQGTWIGTLFGPTPFQMTIGHDGTISGILVDGSPSTTLLGGSVDEATDRYTATIVHDTLGPTPMPMLVDPARRHAALVLVPGGVVAYTVVLEREAGPAPLYFASDILGNWSGYGCAYDQPSLDFETFSPVDATAVAGSPDPTFTVTWGSTTLAGVYDQIALGQWTGYAYVTNAHVVALMSRDKEFVAVQAWPPSASGLEDYAFFALGRQ